MDAQWAPVGAPDSVSCQTVAYEFGNLIPLWWSWSCDMDDCEEHESLGRFIPLERHFGLIELICLVSRKLVLKIW